MKPNIPIPCSEDWNKMKIGQIGRHCGVCEKTVVDFTQKSRHEILSYLIENRHKEVCGHVRLSQLDIRHEDTLIVIRDLESKYKNSNLSFYLLTMATLTLMACESDDEKTLLKTNTEIQQTQKGIDKNGIINDTVSVESNDKKAPLPNCEIKKNVTPITFGVAQFGETTVDGGMQIEPPLGGAMEIIEVYPQDQIVDVGEIELSSKPRLIVEKMPEFPGGTDALINYIQRKLKYPKWEKRQQIEGTVYATFVVNEKGQVTNPQILRSVQGSKNFDNVVLEILKNMPNWIPGEDKGKKVPVQFNLPFKFKL